MANNNTLKSDIRQYIYSNQNEEITGNILRDVLLEMVDTLGDGWTYKGVATPATSPGTPDANVFYIAATPGTYTNFGGKVVADGEVAILKYNGSWTKEVSGAATAAQVTQLGREVGLLRFTDMVDSGDIVIEQGSIGASGENITGKTRLRVKDAIPTSVGEISVPNGFLIQAVFYYSAWTDSTHYTYTTFVSVGTQSVKLDTTKNFARPIFRNAANNNITPGDFTDALNLVSPKIDALGHEVSDKIDDMWYKQADLSGVSLTNNYLLCAVSTRPDYNTQISNSSCAYTDYIDISGATGGKIKISCMAPVTPWIGGCIIYDSGKSPLEGYVFGAEAQSNAVEEIVLPAGAAYVRTSIYKDTATYGPLELYLLLAAGSIPEEMDEIDSEIQGLRTENANLKASLAALNAELMNLDRTSIIAVDLMQMVHARNTIGSLDYMQIVSSTESTITLSSADIAYFPTTAKFGTVAAVGFSDGTYKVVFFGVPDGTTIPRASFDTTDLTNATTIQSLHDTLSSGNGQHLSQSGYIAMGKFVADEMVKKISMIDRNWIGGLVFNTLGLSKGYQNTTAYNAVYDLNDNVVCQPIFYNWMWGGNTPNGNSTPNKRGVESASNNAGASGWVAKCYRFVQGKKDAYIEFPISVSGDGFVEIQAANLSEKATSTGNCKVGLYADGVLVGEQNLVLCQTKFIFENVSVVETLSVRFTLLDNADTDVTIYSIGFWKMYAGVNAPTISASTKIAVLGDSWTQFPGTGLSDHESWNTIVERPDGTQGNGLGYFPKALASFTGAQVDNWGKSDMRADNWGLVMIDTILSHARYDYLIVEFFINDYNSGQSVGTWISNIKAICDKCKRANVRPVFIMPCITNSFSQSVNIGIWHEAVVKGLGAVSNP